MPRFVILEHHWQETHYDLMFECEGALRTWKVSEPLAMNQAQQAELIYDHRLIYLDYEGPLSGGRGQVTRWDAGTYEGDVRAGTLLPLRLAGKRLVGELELRETSTGKWEANFRG